MSHYGGGQFEDADGSLERRIQEELRQRQANSAASRLAGLNASVADRAFMNQLIAADAAAASAVSAPYFAHHRVQPPGAHSPFARPYGALGQPGASPGYGVGHNPADPVSASLYARQRAQYGYGSAAAAATPDRNAYAYAVHGAAGHELYAPHFARSQDQMTMIDRAAAYNAQQRQAEQANAALLQQPNQSPVSNSGFSSQQKPTTPNIASPKSTPHSTSPSSTATPSSSSPNRSRSRKETTPARTPSSEMTEPIPTPSAPMTITMTDNEIDGDDSSKWFSGSVPLGLEDDKYWLSELQVYLRANFAEAFGATEEDIAAPMHGRNKPIALGQVGIRCMHCKHENPAERGQQATSYPSLISGIYNSVQQMLRLHLDCCQAMPSEVRNKIEQLKLSSSSRGGRKQYWVDSAKRLGLVDTPHGIHFGRDPHGPLPPLSGPSVNSKEGRRKQMAQAKKEEALAEVEPEADNEDIEMSPESDVADATISAPPLPPVDDRPLVFPEDKPLISDYLYLTLEQMSPCVLMEADRVGCYKTRKVGFPGLACKHCVGQAGCGRYFPASEASLSQTTTSQTIMNHVRNCRRCPIEIRENLEIMKRARMGPDGKRADKPKHGGRKVFFHRLWCRIQGIPMEDGKGETREKKKRGKKNGSRRSGKKKSETESDDESLSEDEEDCAPPKLTESSEEETETESSVDESDSDEIQKSETAKKIEKKSKPSPWFDGCVRLTKPDDPHWLSEIQCFSRSDLVEVFAYSEEDGLEGYVGRKEPAPGQVGVRCVFCKSLDPSERPSGCVAFPDNLSALHTKVMDMLRLHFHSCPSMPEETKETFKTLRGFGAKVADDSQQYWVDAARDIGLSNMAPGGNDTGWGITFRRDPLQPSPCDELDREVVSGNSPSFGKAYLIRSDDRGLCTDQVLLMMRQVKACTFEKKDRRGGPGARGRDRVIGFPGLCCKHCASKNSTGRYFPVSAKNLTDNTANSLQAHIQSCSRCPESIKASLAYLSHRSILQKAELSGSWKKSFFKKIWDRLHVERAWCSGISGEVEDEVDEGSISSEQEANDEEKEDSESEGSIDEGEKLGDNMTALIKAAAIWLTEQDQVTDTSTRNKASRGRALPSKRLAPVPSPKGKSRSASSLTSGKRRRVHF